MASGGVSSESNLKCQTLVLKVSIHCEGCRKKVHKILKGVPGVYDIEIDAGLNRVTVKSILDAGTLVRRLEKSGKHAELWPEIKPSKHVPAAAAANGGDAGHKKEKEGKEKPKAKDLPPSEKSDNKKSAAQAGAKAEGVKAKSQAEPSAKAQKNKNEETTEKQRKLVPESKKTDHGTATEDVAAVPVDGGGEKEAGNNAGGKKKGKKKAQKEIPDETSQRNFDAPTTNSPPPPQQPQQQQEDMYSSYPPPYPPPPVAAYVMSYHMSQPSVSHAYYASPPPASHGYTYTPYPPPPPEFYGGHPASGAAPPSWIPQPPLHDSIFSDENPNSCSLM